jgi:Domain of unknown function (DUF4226)
VAVIGVDSTLRSLRAQMGSGQLPEWPMPSFGEPVAPIANWAGDASDAAHSRSSDLDRRRQVIAHAHRAVAPVVQDATQTATNARSRLDAVIHSWQADKETLAPVAATPSGWATLIRAGALRVSEATSIVNQTHADFAALAVRVRKVTAELPTSTGVVQAVDFTRGPVRENPPPQNPPYPINDGIAVATDLDGNRVVLRRGYYDAVTEQGFGWDKAYWKHGIVNVNVFKDLIAHSRPVSNENGTLIYDVPINRTHCTKGPFGIIDCQDTGESVTMRIVANVNEPRPDVPDGGQKGVITMYPLPGGSGVVEVEPGWTLTPPWVNNNVPIN